MFQCIFLDKFDQYYELNGIKAHKLFYRGHLWTVDEISIRLKMYMYVVQMSMFSSQRNSSKTAFTMQIGSIFSREN